MKKIKSYITLLGIVFYLHGYGQTYTGKVIDEENNAPIDGAFVGLLSSDSLILNYTSSEKQGDFTLKHVHGAENGFLSFSCLGYRNKVLPLKHFQNGMHITLHSENFRLEEVEVTAQRIIEKKDTLVYSVAGFAMPQDRSIADVIAKMPGLEVKQNGQIEFDGKSISKFYVEGLDLMGDRYALASNNISRKRVKEVQVLRNHQPIELLRGKAFNEQAALNIVLEEDSKYSLVGTVDAGIGANSEKLLYNNRLLGMLFGRNRQNLTIYKNDNTGCDLYQEIAPREMTANNRRTFTEIEESLIQSVTINTPGLDRSRYTFNNSHLAATNHLEKLSGNATLRTQFNYFNEQSMRNNEIETTYLFSDSANIQMDEKNKLDESHIRMDLGVNYEKNNERLYLKNNFGGTIDRLSGNSQTLWNNSERLLDSKTVRYFLKNELELMLPLSADRYWSISSFNAISQLPQQLLLCTDERQKVDYSVFNSHTFASFRHKIWRNMYAKYSLGVKGSRQMLSATIEDTESLSKQYLMKWEPYVGPSFTYQNKSFRLETDMWIKAFLWHFSQTNNSNSSVMVCPDLNLYLSYALNGTTSIYTKYKFGYQLPELRDAYQGTMFITYRNKINNSQTLKENAYHRITLGGQYSQPIQGIFFSLVSTLSLIRNHSAYATSMDTKENILSRTKVDANYTSSNYMLTSRFSKSFGFWKSLLSVNGTYLRRKDAQMNNNTLGRYYLNNYSATTSFSARPLNCFSFEWTSGWQLNRLKSYSADSRINQFKHTLKMVFPISSCWNFSIDNSLSHSDQTKESWFTDISSQYSYKRINFELLVHNLMGSSFYEQELVTSIERTYNIFTIRPRELLIKVSFTL